MVVERGLPRRTVVTQLAKVYHEAQKTDVRHALESAYDVEPVTKEFFTTYRAVFERVMEMVQGVPDAEDRRLFCQALFNRLMFLYFLQRKGWLKFNGDTNYLPALLRASKEAGDENFYRDRLKVLFFEGLNNPQSVDVSRGASPDIGEVPFLNGGLFEEGDIDHACAGADVPNEAFEAILGRLFERFNFTVSENTPYDIEVAVDPEMLGKVFEELVTGRHETGSYYTPRPVVAFMCREVLKGYLETKVHGLSTDAIRTFVDEHDVSGLDLTQADAVSDALDEVTVCDPACGSGAYLVGMLHELIELKQALYSERLGRDPTKLYEMKEHIIERNLYGADIDPFAINIAMLRLWLSLTIEFEGPPPPPALPNLDFKIVCGDSLTAPNPQHAPDLFRHRVHEVAGKLAELKARYLREGGPEKPRLKTQIEDRERELGDALEGSPAPPGSVDWRVEFAEVFDRATGFDIAIANPPYVNVFKIDEGRPGYRELLKTRFATATGRFDLYVPFMERGVELIKPGGMFVFITPNKFLAAEYAASIRRYFEENVTLRSITDLSRVPVFGAAVYPVITIARREYTSPESVAVDILAADSTTSVAIQALRTVPMAVGASLNSWSPFLDPDVPDLLPVLMATTHLEDLAQVTPAAWVNEAYDMRAMIRNDGQRLVETDSNRFVPFIVSGNIRPHHHTWSENKVRYLKTAYFKPVLDLDDEALSHQRRAQITSPKVIVSGMAKRPVCVWDPDGIAAGVSTLYILPRSDVSGAYLAGVLNSTVAAQVYRAIFGALSLAGGFMRFGAPQLKRMPLPEASADEQGEIAALVEAIMAAPHPEDKRRIEGEIESLVQGLFGVGSKGPPK